MCLLTIGLQDLILHKLVYQFATLARDVTQDWDETLVRLETWPYQEFWGEDIETKTTTLLIPTYVSVWPIS